MGAYLIFLGSRLLWRSRLGRHGEEQAAAGPAPVRRAKGIVGLTTIAGLGGA